MRVGIAEHVFKVRGQRSRSHVYKCVDIIMAEAYISTAWRRGSLVCTMLFLVCTCMQSMNDDADYEYNVTITVTKAQQYYQ